VVYNGADYTYFGIKMNQNIVWTWKCFQVFLKTLHLTMICAYMRIKFIIDPSARKKDLAEVTESYDLPKEGLKYIEWRNEYTVSKFFYTWKMVHDFFITQLQDINKTAVLYGSAPNPKLHDPKTGDQLPMLSIAASTVPLVINFGSCT